MKSLRRTILVILLLLLLGAAAGGTYVYIVWSRSDEMLRESVREKLAEIAPGWNVSIGEARLNLLLGQVHLYDVVVPGDDPATPLLDAPEVVLVVDREALASPHPEIRRVRVIRPRVHLVRSLEGEWNFLRLPPLRHPVQAVPEFRWEHAAVAVRLEQSEPGKEILLKLSDVASAMIPSGKRQFLIQVSGAVPFADEMAAEGTWNMADRTWSVRGTARRVRVDRSLIQLAGALSPEFHSGVDRLEGALNQMAQAPNRTGATGVRNAGNDANASQALALSASTNVQFRLAQWGADKPAERQLALQILQGEFAHPSLDYPLSDLRGEIALDNGQVELKSLSAKSGGIQLRIENARVRQEGDLRPATFDLVATDLPLDDRLHRLLPAEVRAAYDSVQPGGRIDTRLHFEFNGRDRLDHEGEVTVRDCTAAHVQFPYRVERINGTITRVGDKIDFKLGGHSGPHRINLHGQVKNPGPEAQALFVIGAAGLPIDDKLRSACPRQFQQVLDQLKAQGELDGSVTLSRRPGVGQEIVPYIKARLRNGTLNVREFPYPIAEAIGEFEGSPGAWTFRGFRGRQGIAELTWSGQFRIDASGAPQLELLFEVKNAECDRTLYAALPAEWQGVWSELSPQGLLRAAGRLDWEAGAAPRIRLDAGLVNGKLLVKSFPIPLDNVQADLGFVDGVVTIRSFKARYNESKIHGSGSADFPESGEWHLHLADMHIDDLEADRSFRNALPVGFRRVVNAFNPQNKLSISGTFDFRGKKREGYEFPVTAAWATETVYTGNTITAGIDLKDMYGTARFAGSWDGSVVAGEGRIELDSVKVLGYQLAKVSGPVRIDRQNKLIVGSEQMVGAAASRTVSNSGRMTAQFIDGQIGLDAIVQLGDPMRYEASVTLANGELKRYAQSYMANSRNLAGLMNGRIVLQGEGTDANRLSGAGQLVVSPAALYDLPLIVAILQALTLTPPQNSAFDQAQFVFDIRNSQVLFQKIDLAGDAVRLIGRGKVRFNSAIELDFYSTKGRRKVPVPLVGPVVDEVIKIGSTGWVGVKVGGTVRDPVAEFRPLPQLDNTLRQLLGNFEPRGAGRR